MLESIGYDSATMSGWAAAADAVVGRVARVDRGAACVLTESGLVRATFGGGVLTEIGREPAAAPTAGDWCVVRDWPDHRRTIETVLPRRTAVIRATAGSQSHGQVLCANVDFACAVVSLHPAPIVSKVERLLTLAWESGARPLVVLTKADLVSDADLVAEDIAAAAPDVEVVCCSAVSGEGLDRLLELVDGRLTLALLGASGHGKSALTNALAGATVLATKAIREDGRGRHTSVRRELVPLPGGGAVIDMPGLRSMGLAEAARGLAGAFGDLETLAGACRFADCSHEGETGCAIRAALAAGTLSLRRFESWSKLRREAAAMAERRDVRVRRQRARHGKKARRELERKPHLDV